MRPPIRDRHVPYPLPHPKFAPFGEDWFGRKAEAFARGFGTPVFLIAQSALVVVWIAVNALAAGLRWDPYPFILLNLAFSVQAAYAAPLVLLAQTRQAERDRILALQDDHDRARLDALLASMDELSEVVHGLADAQAPVQRR